MKVKICGITNLDDALICEKEGADAIGFIFYKRSKRYILPKDAAEIAEKLSPFTAKVGVFVNEDVSAIAEIAEKTNINMVQLHGDENENYCMQIKLPVIKSFRIKEGFDYDRISKYNNVNYLLDSFVENNYGGTGSSFNWELIPMNLRDKIILSGGISEKNIEYIFKNIFPSAVDLSSSLESKPGKKDEWKVKSFFKKFNSLRLECL
jgi:phosphoribosylanthranilate isomerase